MLITLTNTGADAADFGYLLHKNPQNLHSVTLSAGQAHVFYPEVTPERCTACLLVAIDPVALVRGTQRLEEYVNDCPYVASSYLTVALGRVFGTALAGNCATRPEPVQRPLALTAVVEVVRARGGTEILTRLFEPLGYRVTAERYALDPQFPEWGESSYYRLTLKAEITAHDLLSHLYVLLPVLDEHKHYYLAQDEVDKLFRHGEGWLAQHPERELIIKGYLKRRRSLVAEAFERLAPEGEPVTEEVEKELERPMTLHTLRLHQVAARLKALGAKSVVDLGCGEGKLVRRLLADRSFEKILAMDLSHRALETAAERLRLDTMPARQRARVEVVQGSLLYRDARLTGYDAAALVEVIEHLDTPRLAALERVVFEFARPRWVVLTTPNREYNALFPNLPEGKLRHGDHRFEWTRAQFAEWASRTAERFGYQVQMEPVGPVDERHGAPSQMAVFSLEEAA